ncbi:MAG: isocitrate/isopropylmalate dehydrogenase family protein [Actinomycetia bacterium]|nr:isocitrate/isopropylmalate dehydrogenase family protein [Actinomycetes bacterium]
MTTITLIEGDGIGPEICDATLRVLTAVGFEADWDVQPAGAAVLEAEGSPLPQRVLDSIAATGLALKGPVTTPVGTGFRSINVCLRQTFDLYANIRPCRSFPGLALPFSDVDVVIFRENTEDLYAGIEFAAGSADVAHLAELAGGKLPSEAAVSLKPITEAGSRRIVTAAFDYARDNGRHKVTAVHKANIMKETDGLFLRVAREVAAERDIAFDELIVDAACMKLVTAPSSFDVIVTENLYGDILSDLCAGLIGGLGLAAGANIGEAAAVFEAVHGSAPDIAGKGIANPTALILSAALMLRHVGEAGKAARIESAVARVIAEGRVLTADLTDNASAASTREYTDALVAAL